MFEKRKPPSNKVLRDLDLADLQRICPLLERAELLPPTSPAAEQSLVDGLWFPESGLISMRSCDDPGLSTEVALIGAEAAAGVPVSGLVRYRFVVLARGVAHVIAPENIASALTLAPSFGPALEAVTLQLLDHVAATADANARGRIVERLARWLLLAHDRMSGDALFVTHETLAGVLGVRRVGVTNALHLLESHRQIRAARGRIRIIDRAGLAESAKGLYRAAPPPPPASSLHPDVLPRTGT